MVITLWVNLCKNIPHQLASPPHTHTLATCLSINHHKEGKKNSMTTSYIASIIFLHSGIPSTSFTLPATPLLSLSFTPVFHQLPLPYHLQRFYHLLSLSHSIPFLHTTINTIPTPYLPSYYHQHHSPSPFPSHSQQHHFYPLPFFTPASHQLPSQ